VKDVVASVAINPNTVLKAYRELEHAGLVEGRPGVGTFVVRLPPGPPAGAHIALARSFARWVDKARAQVKGIAIPASGFAACGRKSG